MNQVDDLAVTAGDDQAISGGWPRAGIRKILFATDLSTCSRQAFAPVAALARRFEAELHLFHAVVLFGQGPHEPMFCEPASDEAYAAAAGAAEKKLAALAGSSCAQGTKLVTVQRAAFGAAAAILEYAEEAEIDLVVMGTHGRSGAGRLLLGSVAEEVMRRVSLPVLVMRDLGDGKNRPLPQVRHIVVPVDYSLSAHEALLAAGDVAMRYGARLTLLHVIEEHAWAEAYRESVPAVLPPRQELSRSTELRLRVGARMLPCGVPYDLEILRGEPAVEIVAFAERTGADLIVMSSRGLRGIERLVFGSTAESVIRSADPPVMVLHPAVRSDALALRGRVLAGAQRATASAS